MDSLYIWKTFNNHSLVCFRRDLPKDLRHELDSHRKKEGNALLWHIYKYLKWLLQTIAWGSLLFITIRRRQTVEVLINGTRNLPFRSQAAAVQAQSLYNEYIIYGTFFFFVVVVPTLVYFQLIGKAIKKLGWTHRLFLRVSLNYVSVV